MIWWSTSRVLVSHLVGWSAWNYGRASWEIFGHTFFSDSFMSSLIVQKSINKINYKQNLLLKKNCTYVDVLLFKFVIWPYIVYQYHSNRLCVESQPQGIARNPSPDHSITWHSQNVIYKPTVLYTMRSERNSLNWWLSTIFIWVSLTPAWSYGMFPAICGNVAIIGGHSQHVYTGLKLNILSCNYSTFVL